MPPWKTAMSSVQSGHTTYSRGVNMKIAIEPLAIQGTDAAMVKQAEAIRRRSLDYIDSYPISQLWSYIQELPPMLNNHRLRSEDGRYAYEPLNDVELVANAVGVASYAIEYLLVYTQLCLLVDVDQWMKWLGKAPSEIIDDAAKSIGIELYQF